MAPAGAGPSPLCVLQATEALLSRPFPPRLHSVNLRAVGVARVESPEHSGHFVLLVMSGPGKGQRVSRSSGPLGAPRGRQRLVQRGEAVTRYASPPCDRVRASPRLGPLSFSPRVHGRGASWWLECETVASDASPWPQSVLRLGGVGEGGHNVYTQGLEPWRLRDSG